MTKINKIGPDDNDFLQIVKSIDVSIKSLWCIGSLPSERRPAVAIVGTRKPTPYGKEVAYRLAYDLASKGVVIISGLAIGVDGIAHQAALDAGGTTIAVLHYQRVCKKFTPKPTLSWLKRLLTRAERY